jgi:hypothetical protein
MMMQAQMPDSMMALPKAAQTMFMNVMQRQMNKGDSQATAMKIAWSVVKSKFKQVDGVWVARDDAFVETQYYTFEAEPSESFITRSEDGSDIHNYVLTDVWEDAHGTSPTGELMQEWANWLNEAKPEGDVDHELFNKAISSFGPESIEKVSKIVAAKKGIGKIVKAIVQEGQLLVSVAFDKRYANHVPKIKGLSIEAAAVKDGLTGKLKKGKLLGYSFMVNKNPSNARSRRIL